MIVIYQEQSTCTYLWQDIGEVLQRQVIGSTLADRRQVKVGETVERQSLQHQLEAGTAQCIVGKRHGSQVAYAWKIRVYVLRLREILEILASAHITFYAHPPNWSHYSSIWKTKANRTMTSTLNWFKSNLTCDISIKQNCLCCWSHLSERRRAPVDAAAGSERWGHRPAETALLTEDSRTGDTTETQTRSHPAGSCWGWAPPDTAGRIHTLNV